MKLFLNDKKITQAKAKELVGEKRFKEMVKEAKQAFVEDPYEEISYFIGKGVLIFEF